MPVPRLAALGPAQLDFARAAAATYQQAQSQKQQKQQKQQPR